jgi:hypothetical protein
MAFTHSIGRGGALVSRWTQSCGMGFARGPADLRVGSLGRGSQCHFKQEGMPGDDLAMMSLCYLGSA